MPRPKVVQTSVSEFLRTGRLGPLRLGLSFREVVEMLGPPEWVYHRQTPPRLISYCTYGSLEVHFDAGGVHLIQLQHPFHWTGRMQGFHRLPFEADSFSADADVASFERFARRHAIRFRKVQPTFWKGEQYENEVVFLTEGAVAAWFGRDDETGSTCFIQFNTGIRRDYTGRPCPVGFAREPHFHRSMGPRWRKAAYIRERLYQPVRP